MDTARFYQLRSSNGLSLVIRRGEGAPKMVGGGPRFRTLERPRRTSVVQWQGDDPYRMDVPILFDGWADSTSVESDIAKLNTMRLSDRDDLVPPPTVRIDGAVPVKGAAWFIEGVDWGDNVIWHVDGDRMFRYRQDCVVHLLQIITEKKLKIRNADTKTKIHKVKKGETLRSIAKDEYGDANKTKPIMTANNLRDPKKIKVGMNLKIPRITATVHK